jgi:hypothetical protein
MTNLSIFPQAGGMLPADLWEGVLSCQRMGKGESWLLVVPLRDSLVGNKVVIGNS